MTFLKMVKSLLQNIQTHKKSSSNSLQKGNTLSFFSLLEYQNLFYQTVNDDRSRHSNGDQIWVNKLVDAYELNNVYSEGFGAGMPGQQKREMEKVLIEHQDQIPAHVQSTIEYINNSFQLFADYAHTFMRMNEVTIQEPTLPDDKYCLQVCKQMNVFVLNAYALRFAEYVGEKMTIPTLSGLQGRSDLQMQVLQSYTETLKDKNPNIEYIFRAVAEANLIFINRWKYLKEQDTKTLPI